MAFQRVGLTFDTGALIALERRTQRIWEIYRTAMVERVVITVPVAVVIEWWRGRTDVEIAFSPVSVSNRSTPRLPKRPARRSCRWPRQA
jgi:hypothetical protein